MVLAAFAAAGATGHAETVRVAGDPSSVDIIFSDIEEKAPGCALGAAQNGVTLLSRQYGFASLEHSVPITADTVFDAASVSKQFTAFAILLLAEEGKLSLEDQVRKHVPELPDYGTPITLRHLLHHTSGLRDYGDLFSLAGSKAANPVTETETYDLIFKQKALNFRPGTQRQYNNTGYLLLGRIVEKIAGTPLKVFAAERIFRPLEMGATYFQGQS
jgi:CubicO group peptidase (beta-lactamase class C family)